mmetsp:Transcript_7497/g.15571  ORF Transcript_7497/g.15571 Transcript_7497/m.15571 type:complete len:200 (+) Transcript_7497:496-1095(+)
MRKQRKPFGLKTQICNKSSIFKLCEKTSVRCPLLASAGNMALRQRSFAACPTMASASRGNFRMKSSMFWPTEASSASATPPGLAPTSSVSRLSIAPPDGDMAESTTAASASTSIAASTAAPMASASALPPLNSIGAVVGLGAPASERRSAHSFALPVFKRSNGWLQRRFNKPIARKTSIPSLDFWLASRMISLSSKIVL